MKVVIWAGGLGTRLSEETELRPKPMVEIGGRPILWHIMKHFSAHGFNEFILALGYKGEIIKRYFSEYHLHQSDLTIDIRNNAIVHHETYAEPWKVTLVDTGPDTMTGGRLKRLRPYLDGPFMATYGDGVSNVDLKALAAFHRAHGRKATLTAVVPTERFGVVDIGADDAVLRFREKPQDAKVYISGGYFVLDPSVLDLVAGDATVWERAPLESLAAAGDLKAFRHDGFWQCMDTLRDKIHLEDLWRKGDAPWKVWD